jgi:hypothetical protein
VDKGEAVVGSERTNGGNGERRREVGGSGKGDRRRDRSVELVPFHGSLETIILIKLSTRPTPRI